MLYDDLAQKLFGAKRAESNAVLTDATTGTIHGRALTDSADGSVVVEITGDVTNPDPVEIDGEVYYADADTGIEIPTSENVKAGDEVLVSVYGEGTLRSPVVTAAIGSGDRVAGMAQDAYDLADSVEGIAQQALDVAEATGQHFWDSDDGAHVTELPREEWETQQTGPNSLWNSLGMLFRDGLNNLLAIVAGSSHEDSFTIVSEQTRYPLEGDPTEVTSVTIGGEPYTNGELVSDINGSFYRIDYFDSDTYAGQTLEVAYRSSSSLALYDGEGNTSDDIVATFSAHIIELGRSAKDALIKLLDGVVYFRATNYGTEQDPQYVANIVSGHGLELVSKGSDDSGRGNISVRGSKNSLDQAYSSITLDVASSTDNATISLEASNGTLLQLAAASAGRLYTGSYTIPDVIAALTKDHGTITLTNASTTRAHECFRRGWTVQCNITTFHLNAALATGRNVVIGTIPAGFRPSVGTFEAPYCNNATYAGRVFVSAGTDGNIVLFNFSGSSLPTSVTFTASFTYILN